MDKTLDSNEDGSNSASHLLSKVVKFIKNPATDWSDIDRLKQAPPPDPADSESKLALKEMIERKRRNDFVRNREFDMLRKLMHKEMLKDGNVAPGQASFSNNEPANAEERSSAGERAQTLKKIDAIEAQMANAWFKRKEGDTREAPLQGAAVDADQAHAAPVTNSTQLNPVAVRAFAPTEPMDYAAPTEPGRAPPPVQAAMPADEPVESAVAKTGLALPPSSSLGGLDNFQIEVVAATKMAPEIEEAAIRFANGDAEGAETGLRDLVADGGGREDDVHTWLTLFDLYRAIGEQDKFDDLALHFAARFGRSAPQWGVEAGASSRLAPVAAAVAPAAASHARFHWTCPAVVSVQSIATLNASLARNAAPWRIDWHRLETIDPMVLPALNDTFQNWAKQPVQFQFLGTDQLLRVLGEKSPTDDRNTDPLWWKARLAALRVLGEMEEFELVALNYCVTYEVSPPAWEKPKNSYSPLTEDGELAEAAPAPEPAHAEKPAPTGAGFGMSDFMPTDFRAADDGIARPELAGELLESAESALGHAQLTGVIRSRAIEFNCRNLIRVDFSAAGDLLNWSIAQKDAHRQVSFKQVNRLVAAFFGVIGITEAARVVLRTD